MTKKIKVLEAIRQGQVGGGETHVFDLSTRLDPQFYEPIVLSFTDGEMVDNLREKGIETHVIHTTKPFDPKVFQSVKKLMNRLDIDIVHAHGTRAASNTMKAARKLKLPLIYTIHGWSFNDSQSYIVNLLRRKTEQYIALRTTLNICVSESNRQTGVSSIRNFQAKVINNGISLEKFSHKIDSHDIRKELDMKDDQVWIGFIARMTYQKDPLSMLRAFALAKQKNQQLKLIMVGGGELEEEVKKLIKELNLEKDVQSLPFRKDIPAILKAIDIYCLPSLWEGLPIGILEAMAMKKPIIATKVDGTKEIINDSNGILIQPKNISELSGAILEIANNSDKIQSMGEAGYSQIINNFLIGDMVKKTEKVYSDLSKTE